MEFSLKVFFAILQAVPITLIMTIISFVLSLLIAIVIAIVDYFNVPILKKVLNIYVSFFRGTPLIPQLFLLYFGIPTFIPAMRNISAFTICILGLTLNSAAYMKEVIRGALILVPNGQIEAGLSHGMTNFQVMFHIILPQSIRVAIPSLFNNLVDILKGTSVAFTIGVLEMTAIANLRASVTFNYFEAYLILMLMYWLIVVVFEKIQVVVEKKYSTWNKR